ncbi:MAG: hypothetical protein QOD77_1290 [Thermoplasmata archaeon]|jgi:hypothetical protein|nr:hypothetical protein [Thermoplasmata archaeon]
MRALCLLAVALLAAGCSAPADLPQEPAPDADCAAPVHALPLPASFLESTVAGPWDTLLFAPDGFGADLPRAGAGNGTAVGVTEIPGGHLANLTVPGVFAQGTAWFGWGSGPGRMCADPNEPAHALEWALQRGPAFPPTAAPGKGVHVLTAGFFDNGTLFYTNIPDIDASLLFPKPSWYVWEGDAPLPVYVYDQEASEQPAYWKAPSRNLPGGTPAEPAFGAARGVLAGPEAEAGLGYFATIRGFNEALKDLPMSTTRVVRMAPEDAYTRPGNEASPLYGQSLTFLIKAVAVVDAPCPPDVMAQWECRSPLP